MTTLAAAVELVQERFATTWDQIDPAVPYAAQGEAFEAPAASAWARLSIQEAASDMIGQGPPGARQWRRDGVATVVIYAPGGDRGRGTLDALLDTARGIFEGLSFSDIHFTAALVGPVSTAGQWLVGSVNARFHFYQQH